MKKLTSIRLSFEADNLIKLLSKKLSVSRSDIIELSIRKFAEQENIDGKKKKVKQSNNYSHT